MFFKTILSLLVVCCCLPTMAQGINTNNNDERGAAELAEDLNYVLEASRIIE